MLLAIDTSTGTSVAVVARGETLSVNSVQDTRRHAEVIGELIKRALSDAGVGVANLTGIAVGMGPGPFTGLRVGIAAAQAFAFGAGLPLLRVASHDAAAFGQFMSTDGGPLLITTDARRQERYWSAYRGVDEYGIPHRTAGPGIARPESLPESVTDYDSYARANVDWVSAASLGRLAEKMLECGTEPADLEPLYLRSPDVTTASTRKRVS